MQNKKVKISLVMATYNGEKYIVEQLDSIKNQTRPADEILIADDCSTDSTVEIIEKYIVENNLSSTWHLVVNPVNKGWQKNFIDLINMATGDFIFLSDQDDICLPNKFERMIDVISQTPGVALLACSFNKRYEHGSRPLIFDGYRDFAVKPYGKHGLEQVKFDRYWPQNLRHGCCFCFKKEIIPVVTKLWFETCPHDLLIWGITLAKGQVYILNERLHYFRRHCTNNSPNAEKKAKARITTINWYLGVTDAVLNHKDELRLASNIVKKLKCQRNFYAIRIEAIANKNIFLLIFLLTKMRSYPKYFVSWVADVISSFR
ncbi:MAG: glycosyltransferase [Synergistaceae bacterium]|nr:glycosyltransferase [Synergistaceae bacterium]